MKVEDIIISKPGPIRLSGESGFNSCALSRTKKLVPIEVDAVTAREIE